MKHWERFLGVASAAVGVVLLFVGVSVVLVQGQLAPAASYTLVAGLALVIAFVVLDPGAVADIVRSRRARFGSLSVLVSAVVIGILIMVNVVASRGSQAADLTRSGLYTLSPKSALVTKKLDSDLRVTGFYRPSQADSKRQMQDLLSLYQQQSRYVKVQFLDPDQNATQALRLGVTIAGSIVMQYKERSPVVLTLDAQTESDVTGAMLRLDQPGPGTAAVYIITIPGSVMATFSFYFYGDQAAATAARENPLWQAWIQERFPMPPEPSKSE